MKFNTIHSLGSRCQNSEILKHYGYREFAGFFDFMNTDNVRIIKHILSDNFNEILKEENNVSLVCNQLTKDPETGSLLPTSIRTNNKFYNKNYMDVHTSIFPHHNLNDNNDKEHFIKCKKRFENLKYYNTLFNYTFNKWENEITYDDMEYFVKMFHDIYGFKNFRICFIGVNNTNHSVSNLIKTTNFYDHWELNINNSFTGGLFGDDIDNQNYINIIKKYNISDNRITKKEIDSIAMIDL
jgi:hypothetical protein